MLYVKQIDKQLKIIVKYTNIASISIEMVWKMDHQT